ncbi:dihydrofolate reductase [Rhizobium sp. S95]|uniref:Dihydrofolate reductase n=1 Tax=Ciceribacter sichuanensis TaxID=2949647 RepID=A0AAJ1F742_9HYPH|nr:MULTISPECIES: dihydrofolate reductase [unclassified Ciceribacter]MCM2399131.1 dihydrofolate reductase [Ciceribacter sp. S95]MCO5956663.1 dihydrofolate reductase [Ciceribacter sp. S101]
MSNPEIVIVVAMASNNVIGRNGDMPWKLSTDLKRFKALTLGKPLVMGRKTFESVGGKPLPGRPHVIVSRGAAIDVAGVETVRSLDEAIERSKEIAVETGVDEVCVAGGGEIYRQALPLAGVLHVTHVEAAIEGDTVFPEIDPAVFEKVQETLVPAGEKDNYPTRYTTYRRRPAA